MHAYYKPSYVDPEFLSCQSNHLALEGTRCTAPFEYVAQGISSLTTVDLSLTCRMENGLKFRAGGANILDRDPPRALSYSSSRRVPYDRQRWNARGQVFFLEVNWEFGADD